MLAYICDHSYMGNIFRRIMVQTKLGKKVWQPTWKITEAKTDPWCSSSARGLDWLQTPLLSKNKEGRKGGREGGREVGRKEEGETENRRDDSSFQNAFKGRVQSGTRDHYGIAIGICTV
jgi:hypothetical protein